MPLSDIAVDPTTGDLLMVDGDLVLLTDSGDALVQAIRVALRTWRGEWFLNATFGADYRGKILRKNPPRAQVMSEVRRVVEAVPGVRRVVQLAVDYDRAARRLDVTDGVVEADNNELLEFTG